MHILILLQKFAAGPGSFNTQDKKDFFQCIKNKSTYPYFKSLNLI